MRSIVVIHTARFHLPLVPRRRHHLRLAPLAILGIGRRQQADAINAEVCGRQVVPEVRAALGANDLRATRSSRGLTGSARQCLPERRPARARIIGIAGIEQRMPAAAAAELPGVRPAPWQTAILWRLCGLHVRHADVVEDVAVVRVAWPRVCAVGRRLRCACKGDQSGQTARQRQTRASVSTAAAAPVGSSWGTVGTPAATVQLLRATPATTLPSLWTGQGQTCRTRTALKPIEALVLGSLQQSSAEPPAGGAQGFSSSSSSSSGGGGGGGGSSGSSSSSSGGGGAVAAAGLVTLRIHNSYMNTVPIHMQ
jgi:uncharacterized membrane protein YgcG